MTHEENAIAALEQMNSIDAMAPNAFVEAQRLAATSTAHAMLAQADATERHTQVITAFMASTMTNAQAKVLIKALSGMGAEVKP
jgi:BRCT domain type II-containing protein